MATPATALLSTGSHGTLPVVTMPPAPAGMRWWTSPITGQQHLEPIPKERSTLERLRTWHETFATRCENARPPSIPR